MLTIAQMPAPIMLCTLRPPFECLNPPMTGRQYMEGDSPAALWWLTASLVIAPLMSLVGAWALRRSRVAWSRMIAGLAIVPNLVHFVGIYAFPAFHPLVLGLTLLVFFALMLPREHGALVVTSRHLA